MATPIPIGISAIPAQYLSALLVVIALILTLRVYMNIKGTKYTPTKVYRAPLMYLVLVFLGIADINPTLTDIAAVILAIVVGYFVGRRLAGGVKFFQKDHATYYKRSPIIMVIWLISFIARLALEYITIPGVAYLAIVVEVILALTTGMIIGEAQRINNAYTAYASSPKT